MDKHNVKCACKACHDKRVANGTLDAYMKMLQADTDAFLQNYSTTVVSSKATDLLKTGAKEEAKATPAGNSDDSFIKNLFKTVQGVNYDSRCPHGLPYYACMSCSH